MRRGFVVLQHDAIQTMKMKHRFFLCPIVLAFLLRFEHNGEISGLTSVEGEVVPLATRIRPAAANGAVERWLVQVRV
jgi:hypothetical protein